MNEVVNKRLQAVLQLIVERRTAAAAAPTTTTTMAMTKKKSKKNPSKQRMHAEIKCKLLHQISPFLPICAIETVGTMLFTT